MANVNSYYLYQKYEKRGDQPWIPLDVYSVDGDGTMPLVLKEHSSDSCPVIPDGTDDYAYTEWRSADGYMCDDGTKYARERRYVSNDNVNWTATDIYRITDTVIQYNSTDCGYSEAVEEYNCEKWEVVANDYICNEGNKYQKLRKYVRVCNDCDDCSSSWVGTSIYQIGDTVIEYNSDECGYTASTQEFRWVNVGYVCVGNDKCYRQQKQVSYTYGETWENLSEYRTGDVYQKDSADCTITPVIYRWVDLDISQDYYCEGTTKYYKQQYQKSYDNGSTWVNEAPPQYKKGSIAEELSVDCGYTGETIYRWVQTTDTICVNSPNGKFEGVKNTSQGTSAVTVPCDSSSAITSGDTKQFRGTGGTLPFASVVVGDCVTTIADGAFYQARILSSVYIPPSVTVISSHAFSTCISLQSINLPPSVTVIGNDAFGSCYALSRMNSETNGVINIPDSVTEIGREAFSECKRIQIVNLPNSVTEIGGFAFQGCTGLTNINIPNSVTYIGDFAFWYCENLTSSIVIPNSVTTIGTYAFASCTGLTSVTIFATTPPDLNTSYPLSWDAFQGTPIASGNGTIYVPSGSLEAYQTADGWNKYADVISPIT